MKIGFVTCVQLGLSCIEAIYEEGFELDTVFTLHDNIAASKAGRIFVDEFAKKHDIVVHKLRHVNDEDAVRKYRTLDWLFIIGWSQIAGPEVIRAPKYGVLGIHPTLLPTGRGRAAIPWAILKELPRTGITLFRLDEGVDTGPIAAQIEISLRSDTTATQLYQQVIDSHVALIRQVLPQLENGTVNFIVQDDSVATVWPARRPEDGLLDLKGSVHNAERLVRAVTRPYPGAYYFDSDRRKIIVWAAEATHKRPTENYLEFDDGFLKILQSDIVPESRPARDAN